MKRALLIIPTYNERENVRDIVRSVLAEEPKTPDVSLSVLIVDDNSPDGTADLVLEMQQDPSIGSERLHLLKRAGKMGLGTAYVAGFKYGLERGFD